MIYELRVYEVAPGRMQELHDRFRNHTLALFGRHSMKVVGFFNSDIGEKSDRLTYILEFIDLAHRERAWADFLADPEWQSVFSASNRNGALVHRLRSSILRPTDYSPLK